jgi:hypothetical protein
MQGVGQQLASLAVVVGSSAVRRTALASVHAQLCRGSVGVTHIMCCCRVDESHLTGESDDVVKEPPSAASAAAAAGSGGRNGSSEGVGGQLSSCLCMSGSKVLEGFGRMLVLAVGPNSQQVRRACACVCF